MTHGSSFSTRRRVAALLLAAACMAATQAHAAPGYGEPYVTDRENARSGAESFKRRVGKLFVIAPLNDIGAGGQQLTSVWFAVETRVAPPNTQIGILHVKAPPHAPRVTFGMSPPDGGWPEGEYRVELLMNGIKVTEVEFSID